MAWHTANDAVLTEGRRLLIDDPARLEGVTTLDVDEHVWRHTRHGDNHVTVIIDLTPIREKTGPARLLDPARRMWVAGWRVGPQTPGGTRCERRTTPL